MLYLFVPNSPYYKSYWFTNDDRVVVLSRKRHDQGGADTSKSVVVVLMCFHLYSSCLLARLKWDQAVEAFIDPKTYLFFLLGFSGNIPNVGGAFHCSCHLHADLNHEGWNFKLVRTFPARLCKPRFVYTPL